MIKYASSEKEANAVTHAGLFHADEVMATVILSHLHQIRLSRVFRVPDDLPESTLVYDIGRGKYDHHQKGGNGSRENGIRYASCGLIWRDFGHAVIAREAPELSQAEADAVWRSLDERLMSRIDAADNGEISREEPTALAALISSCNPAWDQDTKSDDAFLEAASLAEIVFLHALRNAISAVRAESLVHRALSEARPPILVLDRFMPWQQTLFAYEKETGKRFLFVLFPAIRGGFNCQCVPEETDLFCPRTPFPEAWRALKDEELRMAAETPDAIFCHPAGFLASAQTQAGAIRMAEQALRNKEQE